MLQAERINERHQNEVEDAKRKLQAEIDRLKGELSAMQDKHQTELDDERESYKKVFGQILQIQYNNIMLPFRILRQYDWAKKNWLKN